MWPAGFTSEVAHPRTPLRRGLGFQARDEYATVATALDFTTCVPPSTALTVSYWARSFGFVGGTPRSMPVHLITRGDDYHVQPGLLSLDATGQELQSNGAQLLLPAARRGGGRAQRTSRRAAASSSPRPASSRARLTRIAPPCLRSVGLFVTKSWNAPIKVPDIREWNQFVFTVQSAGAMTNATCASWSAWQHHAGSHSSHASSTSCPRGAPH